MKFLTDSGEGRRIKFELYLKKKKSTPSLKFVEYPGKLCGNEGRAGEEENKTLQGFKKL